MNCGKFFKNNWPFVLSTLIFIAALFIILNQALSENNNKLIYALDDPYIHLSIAKNLAEHGIWGIGQVFSSASSSLLFPLLLAFIYKLTGFLEYAPLIINAAAAITLIFIMLKAFSKKGFSNIYSFSAVMAVLFFTPVLPLVFSGMEHILQIVLFLALIIKFAGVFEFNNDCAPYGLNNNERVVNSNDFFWILILSVLLSSVRYEGLFMAAAAALVFIHFRQFQRAFLIVLISALPALIFGLISKYNGYFFLPSSILLKGNFPDISKYSDVFDYLSSFLFKLYANPHIIILFVIFSTAFAGLINKDFSKLSLSDKKFDGSCKFLLFVYLFSLISHLQFCQVGWFYRYEAYLAASGIFLFFYILKDFFEYNNFKMLILKLALFAVLFFPFFLRGYESIININPAIKNIYQQQYQMGLFLNKYYQNCAVALNDVGAAVFFSNIKCVDLYGLASNDVASAKISKKFTTDTIKKVCGDNGVKIAVLYEHWFGGAFTVPHEWVKVAEWGINNPVVAGGDTVSFFAANESEAKKLYYNLKDFTPILCREVNQKGIR